MSRLRAGLCLLAALLAGCGAKLSSSLPASAPVVSYVGAQAGVLAPAAVPVELEALQRDLEQIARDARTVPARLSRAGDVLTLRLGADESFGPASAQLDAAALEFYATLAEVLRRRPGTVGHILVHGDAASADPTIGLTARRASSLLEYLVARGVPGTRLRAEGRGAVGSAPGGPAGSQGVELVLKPIVAGREAEAWRPPS